jgi:acetoacetyl-CoA synthetase
MHQVHLPPDPAAAERSQMSAFMRSAAGRAGRAFDDYHDLHRWACEHYRDFWQLALETFALDTAGSLTPACEGNEIASAQFFPRLRLNYAQTLLRPLPGADDSHPAVIWRNEAGERRQIDRGTLRAHAMGVAAHLQAAGVQPGDRVVALARNSIEAIEACLGATAIGAAWSSVAPDLGTEAVLGRFRQLEPVVLFADLTYTHHGMARGLEDRVRSMIEALPSVRTLVVLSGEAPQDWRGLRENLDIVSIAAWTAGDGPALCDLPAFPFNHPLFILFSSGTTGAPKCIVHGAGGTLLEHLKEHRLHTDLGPADRLFFITSCGWMMWNWQLSALASGTPIVLYDGSVSFPDATALLHAIDAEQVSVFGLSPAYVQLLKDSGIEPRTLAPFKALRAFQSTGSILFDNQFDWLGGHFKHAAIHSISGGTDIIGCFVLGNPLLPVYRGESQCISLGTDVRVWIDGRIERTGVGELICVNPFPSRPVGIWGDPDKQRFHASYFAEHEGVWTHGDRIDLTERGSARILGRSDGTLKIRGVRIGPAELYTVVLQIPGVREAMAVEQEAPDDPGGSKIALLLVLAEGVELDRKLTLRIKKELSTQASPAHVPALILQVPGLPQTHNGKYSERAARDAINGRSPPNRSALKNPEVLDALAAHPQLLALRAGGL